MSADEKIQSALPTIESDLKHTARNGETDDTEGVLHQDVEPAEFCYDPLNHFLGHLFPGHIAHHGRGFATGGLDALYIGRRRRLVDVDNENLGFVGRQRTGDFTADPGCATGNNGDPTGQFFNCHDYLLYWLEYN